MTIGKKKSITDSALNQLKPDQLYQYCRHAEHRAAQLDHTKLKVMLAKQLFFGRPLFKPGPAVDEASVISKELDLKIRRQLWQASKYRQVLGALRRRSKPQDRLFFLAWWLSQEGVCEPEYILGVDVLRRMAKNTFKRLSSTDFQHADEVRVWLPYFRRLITDSRSRGVTKLVRLGYDEAAAQAAVQKHSAIEAACSWLADRPGSINADAPALRNAYSRIYGLKRHRTGESQSPVRVRRKLPARR